jgi:peptidoglycan/LPS O-acetylase OafA/YrhL
LSARFSRIASVAYPALLVTVVCDFLGRVINPVFYESVARSDHYWARIFINLVFLSQSGPFSANPGTNAPFWSLAYEVWYYVLFGIWIFVKPVWRRLLFFGLAALVAGPKILLLLPVWVFGVAAHQWCSRVKMSIQIALVLFIVSLGLALGLICGWLTPYFAQDFLAIKAPWYFSAAFWNDYQLGLVVAINLIAADQMFSFLGNRWLTEPIKWPVRFVANRSFSLYAFHMPLLYLASVAIPYQKDNSFEVILVVCAVVGLVFCASLLH